MVCAVPKHLLCSMHKARAAEPPHSAAGVKAKVYFGLPCPCTIRIALFSSSGGLTYSRAPVRSKKIACMCMWWMAVREPSWWWQLCNADDVCNGAYNSSRKSQQRLESKQLYCACVELGNLRSSGWVCFVSCTDASVRETEPNAESKVYLGLKISDHVKRVREALSMRALWEQSLVYTRYISTSGKNNTTTEETMANGTEDLVFKWK